MANPRAPLAVVSIIFIAGAVLLILLTVLGGASDKNPLFKFYFLQADTSGIAGAAPVSRWTLWNVCSVQAGKNSCPGAHAATPLDPPKNFVGPDNGIPPQFIGAHKYYYETRFMFAFVLMSLFFAVGSLFLGLLALCSRIGSFLSGALCSVALFFQTLSAALMTAAYVQGRNAFKSNGQNASLGKYDFGFMWAAVACLFLSTVLFCVGGAASGSSSSSSRRSKGGRFSRKKNRKSTAGYIDGEKGIKDDYS